MAANPIASASISWVDGSGNTNLHVYWTNGYKVYQRVWTGSGWATGNFVEAGEQVSATVFQHAGGVSIRVYCTFQDTLTEWCQDNGGEWYQGIFTID